MKENIHDSEEIQCLDQSRQSSVGEQSYEKGNIRRSNAQAVLGRHGPESQASHRQPADDDDNNSKRIQLQH
jgi:hypothetical protein